MEAEQEKTPVGCQVEEEPSRLTSLLGGLVVGLADQPAVLHEVEFVSRGQLPFADHAGEAVKVVDKVLGPSHHLGGRDALLTGCAFRPKPPVD